MAGVDGNPPIPDPTELTTDALTRAVASERDYTDGQLDVLRERLRGIDKATDLLSDTVTSASVNGAEHANHLRELMEEKFRSVAIQFLERDTRSERESRDNKVAVDAAFAAQKEAASEQNKSNSLAITKSEDQTRETINKLAELFTTTTDALGTRDDDQKERVGELDRKISEILAVKQGAVEQRTTTRETAGGVYALIGAVTGIAGVVGILAAAGVFNGP